MKVKVSIGNIEKYLEDKLDKAVNTSLNELEEFFDPYVPYDTGELSDSYEVDGDSNSVYWSADYAEYVYTMPRSNNFNKDTHPLATSYWVEEAIDDKGKDIIRLIEKNFKDEVK